MNFKGPRKGYLQMHIAVFLFGFTAILGDLINLPALTLVWWRVFITTFSLLFLVNALKLFRNIPTKTLLQFMGVGALVGLHWLCFYGSIKMANASVALVCFAMASFFTALVEPLILKTKLNPYELGLGLIIVPGMALVVSDLDVQMINGVIVGMISSLLIAFFSVLNKKYIKFADEMSITFLELGSAWLFLSLLLPFFLWQEEHSIRFFPPSTLDWAYMLALALLCTTLPYILSLKALHHISAFAANLTFNLEPVYGIVLAWLILNDHEEMSPRFYGGVVIILVTIFSYPVIKRRFLSPQPQTEG